MKEKEKDTPSQTAGFVNVTGKLPSLSAKNLKRLSVYLTQGNTILSESPVSASGTFQFHIAPQLEADAFAVLAPRGLDSQSLASHSDLPSIALSSAGKLHGGISLDFAGLDINDKLIDLWWIWCREYTVSGTLQTAADCPIGAQVTVYNVTCGVSGLVETPIVTVPTDANGNFTASFNWCCTRFCWWPCLPVWWRCWPWWWELDILAVIENLEQRLRAQSAGLATVAFSNVAPLRQPNAADLMTGVGFAGSGSASELQPDSARTALIASKFANPLLRDIFPWWWWCCENPNIVFSASQGATIILNENPSTSTRWCFASGQSVSLTGNSESLGSCQISTSGPCSFTWSSVGNEPGGTLFENISMGYAEGAAASPCNNMAFNGTLNLNGSFGGDCVVFYQVLSGQWGGGGSSVLTAGNPARGGTPPLAAQPLSVQLSDYITVINPITLDQQQLQVILGPCSFGSLENLYMTRPNVQNPPAGVTGLPPFPTIPPGYEWDGTSWAAPDLVLQVDAVDLVSPAAAGGVTLSVAAYDGTGASLPSMTQPFLLGPDLTIMIDTTPLASATIDWPTGTYVLPQGGVYNSDGTPATQTTTGDCPAYLITTSDGGFVLIHTTVVDNAGHLCEYLIQTEYGSGTTILPNPVDRDYTQAAASFTAASTPPPYGVDSGYGVPNAVPTTFEPQVPAASNWTYVGGGDTFYIPITQTCCYDFQLLVGKRTTDGQNCFCSPLGLAAFQTVNIVVTPLPPPS